MFILSNYLRDLTSSCQASFGDRLLYIGLQGSYLRGEAHEGSDIDIMLVLDDFTVGDMDEYRAILHKIGYFKKSCGFICGRQELARWNPLEVCQLVHTTKDIFGVLRDLLPTATRADEVNYVKLSLGNLYHEICHRYIHAGRERSAEKLPAVGKSLFFLIQNLHYLESGRFALTKAELKGLVSPGDREILEISSFDGDLDSAMQRLFAWCQDAFARADKL